MNPCTLICRVCGDVYDLSAEESHKACPACGSENCRPRSEGETLKRLCRGVRLRLQGEFSEALKCYEHVLLEHDDEHEALWGKLLCQYGVEFVTDPRSGERCATVHVPHSRPMQLHGDFVRACELAPEEVRAQYEAEAAYVDEALAEINRHKASSAPYDVFVCHKATPLSGEGFTLDYDRGVQLTRWLEQAGYRVFFAPFAGLPSGASYEAGIYYALWTAKVMLLISSDAAFLTSPWVKSEWTRFLEMLDDGEDKHLIPLMYGVMAEARMPREIRLRGLQSIRMEAPDASARLLADLARYTGMSGQQKAAEPAAPARATDGRFTAEKVEGGVAITRYAGAGGEVTIPAEIDGAQVLLIASKAFNDQTKLTRVVIPDGVKRIGDEAFAGCSSLKDVSIPQSVTDIGNGVFNGCSSLTHVNIPQGVTRLGTWTFSCCSGLTEVQIPQSVTDIGQGAFFNCSGLTDVILPQNMTCIGECAFYGCSALKTVTIPASVTAIGNGAFDQCPDLTLRVHEGSAAHQYAQENGLRHEIIHSAFAPESHFTAKAVEGGVVITGYTGPGGKVVIPAAIGGQKVRGIGEEAFGDCAVLTEIVIPQGVEEIGAWAFTCCRILESVHIPASVRKIGRNPFNYCSAVQRINVAAENDCFCVVDGVLMTRDGALVFCPSDVAGVTYTVARDISVIREGAFEGCRNLRKVIIHADVRHIEAEAFADCDVLTEISVDQNNGVYCSIDGVLVTRAGDLTAYPVGRADPEYSVPEGVLRIGKSAFSFAEYLVRASIPGSVASLGLNAFLNCGSLRAVHLAEGVREIGELSLAFCEKLMVANLPESLQIIGNAAFEGCVNLQRLIIPAGVSHIGEFAFSGCDSLTLCVHEGSAAHRYAQENGIAFEVITPPPAAPQPVFTTRPIDGGAVITGYNGPGGEVLLPTTIDGRKVLEIGEKAFSGCGTLTAVVMQEGLTTIGRSAFSACSGLMRVSFPRSLSQISWMAFAGCSALKEISIPSGVTELGSYAFQGCMALETAEFTGGLQKIGNSAFFGCSALRSVTLPEGITVIGREAFNNCIRLTELYLPRTVNQIGSGAFSGNAALTLRVHDGSPAHTWALENGRRVEVIRAERPAAAKKPEQPPRSVTPPYASENCFVTEETEGGVCITKYTGPGGEVAIPPTIGGKDVVAMGLLMFDERQDVTAVFIPHTVRHVGERTENNLYASCFIDVPNLQKIVVSPGNPVYDAVDGVLFRRRKTLACELVCYPAGREAASYVIPERVTAISNGAFFGAAKLTSVHIPDSVRVCGVMPFAGCNALHSVTVSPRSTLCYCRKDLLLSRDGLVISWLPGSPDTTCVIPDGVKEIWGGAFARGTRLKAVVIPASVKTIGRLAFENCTSLKQVVLPDPLPVIDKDAFKSCPLPMGLRMKLLFAPKPS